MRRLIVGKISITLKGLKSKKVKKTEQALEKCLQKYNDLETKYQYIIFAYTVFLVIVVHIAWVPAEKAGTIVGFESSAFAYC